MLIEQLIADTEPALTGRTVADVRIGLGYTAVLLDDGGCGLASTVPPDVGGSCTLIDDAGELVGSPATALATRASSADTVHAGLGLATINAVLNRRADPDPGPTTCLDLVGKVVGMVGHIPPLAASIEPVARQLHVFDRRATGSVVRGEAEIVRLLPSCDTVILTSQTLVNGSAEQLLTLARGQVALVGPSTPLWPGFAAFGVDHLFGRVVADPPRILALVSQAGGTRRFGAAAVKVHRALS
jgi:uncharacterized protein (DUF4213/DUF364 family)